MDKPITRLLNVPEIPPRAWLTEDSPDMVMGQTLHVVTHGPDEGRAFGMIQPPPDHSAFMPGGKGPGARRHRNYGRRPPDARLYIDGFDVFNRGDVEVMEGDGVTVTTVRGGHLPLLGGHAEEAVGASNIGEAIEWLHREGRWTSKADDLGLVGIASAVDDPVFAGAVMFRGAALPGMTLREAQALNAMSTSAEVWEAPQYDDQLVFAGAVVVPHTAWPYSHVPEALAAEAGQGGECEGPFCVVFAASASDGDEAGVEGAGGDAEGSDPQVSTENVIESSGAVAGCGGGCGGCKCKDPAPTTTDDTNHEPQPQPEPEPQPVPTPAEPDHVAAEGEEEAAAIATEQLAAMEQRLDDMAKMIEDQGVEIAELTVTVFGAEGLGSANQLDEMVQQINDLREIIHDLVQKQPGPAKPDESQGDENAPPASNATVPNSHNSQLTDSVLRSNLQGALRG